MADNVTEQGLTSENDESTQPETDMGDTTAKATADSSSSLNTTKETAGYQAALQRARESENAAKKSKEDLEKRLRELELAQMSKEDRLQQELLEERRLRQQYEEERKAMEEAKQFEDVRKGLLSSYDEDTRSAAQALIDKNPYAVYGDEVAMKDQLDTLQKQVKRSRGEGLWVDSNQSEPTQTLSVEQIEALPLEKKWEKLQEIDRMLKQQG